MGVINMVSFELTEEQLVWQKRARDYPVERLMRNAYLVRVRAVSNDIEQLLIAESLLQ